jgi:hypothetical protein
LRFFRRSWPGKLQKAPISGPSSQDHRLAALNDAAVRRSKGAPSKIRIILPKLTLGTAYNRPIGHPVPSQLSYLVFF